MLYPNPLPALASASIWLLAGPAYIRWLQKKALGQFVREEGPERHHQKAGTPTMGGLLILLAILLVVVLKVLVWPQPELSSLVWGVLGVLVVLGGLGAVDDASKILKRQNKGVGARDKMLIQLALGAALGWWRMSLDPNGSVVDVFGLFAVNLSWFYPVFTALFLAGFSNAYNLTDGLDGLAASTGIMTFMALGFVFQGLFPDFAFLSVATLGALIGFLVFNKYPAKVFMGDTGSLALGGMMAAMAILAKIEAMLVLLGLIYVIEALSVMIQVASFKLTGKRVFKMSPIHHHFELSGWAEPQIVLAFTLFQGIVAGLTLLGYN
jgi:phospho-N-acetylmuramoyl-pentapeptide-transferase